MRSNNYNYKGEYCQKSYVDYLDLITIHEEKCGNVFKQILNQGLL